MNEQIWRELCAWMSFKNNPQPRLLSGNAEVIFYWGIDDRELSVICSEVFTPLRIVAESPSLDDSIYENIADWLTLKRHLEWVKS